MKYERRKGSTSGILLAQDRLAMADEMIKNLVAAYRSRSEK